jgi:hypothetical protein
VSGARIVQRPISRDAVRKLRAIAHRGDRSLWFSSWKVKMATHSNRDLLEIVMQRVIGTALALLCLFATAASLTAAQPEPVAFTEPQEAGADYQLQGEYLGELERDEGKRKLGIQVIALGDGKFRAVVYVGGLPGDGWSRGDERHTGEGELKNGQVQFTPNDPNAADGVTAILKDGKITILRDEKPIAELKEVERKSPTLGKRPPQGAIVLFDGSNADAWENGKLVEKNLLAPTDAATKQKFGDHSLHIEFRTPFMPAARGQGRGNSGVYLQSRYECQVLDSFGLEGEDNECGGIYSIAKPAVNMCYPPLSWQTYDIDFTAARYEKGEKVENARATIKHNGVIIHKDLELPHGTPGRHPEGPEPDSVFLQNHGNPVAFRNIWIVEK